MFKKIKEQVQKNFNKISNEKPYLFYVDIGRDVVWETYLEAFPEELMQENNCNCCKSFLRQYAGIVTIENNKKVLIWDNIVFDESTKEYELPIKHLRNYIHSLPITNLFFTDTLNCGTDKNYDVKNNVTWEHFNLKIDRRFTKNTNDLDSVKAQYRTSKEVLQRALEELTLDSIETVLDLLNQGSLYLGNQYKNSVSDFLKLKREYLEITDNEDKENYCWLKCTQIAPSISGIRNSSIGTLIEDISKGITLDISVARYESKVAPTNYKRPTALITSSMIKQAEEKIEELGFKDSLERRYANETDLSLDNVLFTDKSSSLTNVFQELSKETLVNPKTFSKVEEINIEDFINNVIPTSKSIEILVENHHLNNLVSLITSVNKESKSMFKWDNPFSWSYTGGITDSIKERVKLAGGRVEGYLRISLSWNNIDDLDLHLYFPNNNGHIYFNNKRLYGGVLDVDANAGVNLRRDPVENIIFENNREMLEGNYKVVVNNFNKRDFKDSTFTVQVEYNGEVKNYSFNNPANRCDMDILSFKYSKKQGIIFNDKVESKISSNQKWNIKTNQFVKVKKIMLSPNFWNTQIGNKHYMFFLENCISDEKARPFFNEFLNKELEENRKVFEVLGNKLLIESTNDQLSGLGFSDTQRNSVIVRIESNFKRTLKVNF